MVSVLLLANSFTQNSFSAGNYDSIHQWGSFGIIEPNNFSYPQFITVSDDGSIFVSDFGNKRIQKFSSSGEYVTDWGKSGKQAGEFYNPSGIAVGDDAVFVTDRDLNRIQKFSLDGEFISMWGKKGTGDGQFLFPNGIVVSNGLVYVVDTGNQRIQTFSTEGNFVSSFGSSGLGDGQFLNVVGIDADDYGNIYLTDKGNAKIEKFTADGEFVNSFPFHFTHYVFSPEAIAIDPSGDMFVVNSNNNRILHLSQDDSLQLHPAQLNGPFLDAFESITDIAFGLNGELLIVDSPSHSIQSFSTEFYEPPTVPYYVAPEIIVRPYSDQTKPEIIAPLPIVIEAEDLQTNVDIGNATATDESGIKVILNNAPEYFGPGITNIIWIAFDNVGHSSNVYQKVTVKTCGNDYSDYNLIQGTSGDDVIQGTNGNDLIFGLDGNDLISGGLGDDCIFGGQGNDIVSGDDGNDTIKGNSGNDILKGNSGIDVIYANFGSDVIDGGSYSDRCYIDSGKDLLLNCEE